ncbi:hypothetical protein CcaverHIS002_0404140 [Cutaneotrichosporon cavernicola]|uniref:RRM domain-containing protein n=1 Tax=Cutaneotrichosporon cavernicola TaxID=279322 RepID=A0AA48QVQ3_9TREE|nr:uncharacterized protein CcaverHIS019_0404090 [Cutaneotrichosporon cavernicola]BEI83810.1 hypothetical protein CcaverHIS002_0404140 [Cutaneotrichosporon cavernicola]BEI91589.1 hypothetical protein CcaverHIS019_0404090 [Cutaneotrichosporon cavernicola]BEI99366.1 hypothetical protein CcaverHIS631_0404090 [Cutaneotrichosporon cavernicola]
MTTPPSSLPSPTPSSGSSHQPNKPQTFSSIAAHNPRSSSSATFSTSPSGPSRLGAPGDRMPPRCDASSNDSGEDTQQTPQSQPSGYQNTSSHFLPPVTTSPPPHAPPYVPPAQHAMAPDPIHSLSLSGQSGNVWGPGWRPGPPGAPPGGPNYGPAYGRGAPNGHITHQLPPNPMEAYGPSSRQSMTSTPGVGPLSGINGALPGRSGSQPGEPRDRRRERHRDEESRDRDEEEAISTIFVVGFPDDMSEREFQNIFTFAPGFEAATLKFPSGSRREPASAVALLAELQHIASQQNMGPQMGNQDHQEQSLEETFAALNFGGTQSSTASNTPSAAMSLTPSAPTGAALAPSSSMPQQVAPRRQTIGFAKFKTRGDALAARDHLQGRRIDTITGATLKAEMAKKNLHTKRGAGDNDLVGLLLRSGRLTQLVSQQQQAQAQALSAANAAGLVQPSAGPNMALAGQNPGAIQSAKEAWDAWPAPGQTAGENKVDKLTTTQQGGASSHSNTSGSPPLSGKSPNSRPTDSKALLALAEEADELEGWSVGSVGMGGMALEGYPNTASASGRSGPLTAGPIHGAQSGMSGAGGYGAYGQHGSYSSALGFGGANDNIDPRSLGITANMNPADQNPPINTLYIGNLPAISPPTHPPNFLEESLRNLFSRRPGFKRMSFRQKINGPMCFVEFEDIPFATQAMRDLYGNTLNGLVKGGIRLSYSKNSLGQRGNSHQQAMGNSMFGGIAHGVAVAGMSNAPSGNQMAPGPPGPGSYSMAASQPVPIGPPGGQAGDRRAAEGPSSLSPTAQPFNAPLAPSPGSQRFYDSGPLDRQNSSGSASGSTASQATAIPGAGGKTEAAFNSFGPSSVGGGFSPVSSPIRTPASLGWVSSSAAPGSSGNTYGGFDTFGMQHHGLPSLNGAANAWGQSNANQS